MKAFRVKRKKTRDISSQAVFPERTPDIDSSLLPFNPQTGQPIMPTAQPGYYPGFHTLDQQKFWDEATRKLILSRVQNVPPIRFFTPYETQFMEAVCNRLLPQDDRDEAHKIPLVPFIDERLYQKRLQGYRYEDMPPDDEAYRLGIQGIEAIAENLYQQAFLTLNAEQQDQILFTLHQAKPPAGDAIWQQMPVHRFWLLLMQDVVGIYYAHPYAWDEIGFGGPAYPRGYMRLERGQPEPWEVEEQRYAWQAPARSLSGQDHVSGGPGQHKQQTPGQAGTH